MRTVGFMQRQCCLRTVPSSQPLRRQQRQRHLAVIGGTVGDTEPLKKRAVDETSDLVQIGIIGGTHGVKGEVRVQPTSDFEEDRLGEPGIKWIEQQKMGLMKQSIGNREMRSLGGRRHIYKGHELWILRFEGIDTPEEAMKLNGSKLMMKSEDRGVLPEDEYYIQHLIGLDIIRQEDDVLLGHVESVYLGNGSPDILIIKRQQKDASKNLLLPFVNAFVPEVNLEDRKIYITPPEGLLELNEAKYKPNREGPRRNARDASVINPL